MNGNGYRINEPVPVSGPPAQPPPQGAVGNTGVVYGTQQRAKWAAGDTKAVQVCDVTKAAALWRFSAFGRVAITIDYGTRGTRQILRVLAPVVITLPGQFTATAQPLDDQGTECFVTLTQATAGARSQARNVVGPGPVNLSDDAVSFVALNACTLTISGVAVAVPALSVVPLVSGSVLNTGSGFQEFEP
jgi:hypothetical protein